MKAQPAPPAKRRGPAGEYAQEAGRDKDDAQPSGESGNARTMAAGVRAGKPVSKGYIGKNSFVPNIRRPAPQKSETV